MAGSGLTEDEALSALMTYISAPLELMRPSGTGWYTVSELVEKLNLNEGKIRDRLKVGVKNGEVEVNKVGIRAFYRFKQK